MQPNEPAPDDSVLIEAPRPDDGAELWRIARDSQVLDVNSPYAYLLWCRDFGATSVVARTGGDRDVVGFVTAYVRPDDPAVLMVWQVAVDSSARGRGVAGAMLDAVWEQSRRAGHRLDHLETTITDDNTASRRLFAAFAERHGTTVERTPLFEANHFPTDSGESHAPEYLHRIGPISAA